MDPTGLQTLWFVLIAVLWIGYFILEGYDFGVGMLLRRLSRDDVDKRMVLHSIGPFWDGNEVWLLVAGGATFAAFPEWYATLFSGFYLALFLILVALILRNVGFEFWGKEDGPRWRATWEWIIVGGSALPALLWGVGWANIVDGVPIGADGEYSGTLFDLLGPYALVGGLTTLAVFLLHGAIFLSLRTSGELERRARDAAARVAPVAAVLVAGFLAWTLLRQGDRGGVEAVSAVLAVLSVLLAVAAAVVVRRRLMAAFGLTCAVIATFFVSLFADLFPNAMVSSTDPVYSLPLAEAASTPYTLKVMTIVAVALVPVVLLYQGWTYWVFRARLSREDYEDMRSPLGAISHGGGAADASR
jgi:cytochrome d ubiquinol oxidase subunit II